MKKESRDVSQRILQYKKEAMSHNIQDKLLQIIELYAKYDSSTLNQRVLKKPILTAAVAFVVRVLIS